MFNFAIKFMIADPDFHSTVLTTWKELMKLNYLF